MMKAWEKYKEEEAQQGAAEETGFLLFLVGCGAPCAQKGPNYHHNDGEGSHRDDDDDDQDVIFTVASHSWFTSRGEKLG